MVGLIILTIYLLGIPITFYLIDGHTDFEKDEEETAHDAHERLFSVIISLCISICWPIFWGFCFVIALLSGLFRGF